MTATQTIQSWIEAKERVATLDYGLRAIKGRAELRAEIARFASNREAYLTRLERADAETAAKYAHNPWARDAANDGLMFRAFTRQQEAAQALAEELTGKGIYAYDEFTLRRLLKEAREELKLAEAAKKAHGTLRQLRLAIADECDCYGCGEVRLAGRGAYYCDACVAAQQAEQGDERSAYDAFHEWADRHLIIETIGAAA